MPRCQRSKPAPIAADMIISKAALSLPAARRAAATCASVTPLAASPKVRLIASRDSRIDSKAGSKVKMLVMPGVSHGFIGYDSADAAADWMADRFKGSAPPSDC